MGEIRIGRSVLQPGWRWSESIKPIARTELCEYHHIGLCVSGSARIRMREGAELLIEAGQFYEVPPGHDAWVVSDEPWITIDWQPSTAFARTEGGGFDRVVATLLVTDIVDSTAHALELGDGPWRDLLARHDQAVRAVLDRFRGREVTTTGDGFVAMFDALSEPSMPLRRSVARRPASAWRSGRRSTPARSSWRAATSAARRCTLRRGSQTCLSRARSTPRGRPESSWRARRSASLIVACAS